MPVGYAIPMRALKQRATKGLLLRWSSFLLIGSACFAIVFSTLANERTFSLVARSLGGKITLQGELNDWLIERGVVCRLRAVPDLRATSTDETSPCDSRIYVSTSVVDRVFEWHDGTVIAWKRSPSGAMQFSVLTDETEEMQAGSLLIISDADWRRHSALAFQGIVVIGNMIATGSDDYLLEGNWQALQSGPVASLFRDVTDVVQSGSVSRGSTVDFLLSGGSNDKGNPVTSFGHLTPADDDERGAIIALLTEHAPVLLRVNYFGLRKAALFKPDWIDTLSSSTMLVAVAVLLSILGGLIEIVSTVIMSWRSRIAVEDKSIKK